MEDGNECYDDGCGGKMVAGKIQDNNNIDVVVLGIILSIFFCYRCIPC